jgi:hypothetical protein
LRGVKHYLDFCFVQNIFKSVNKFQPVSGAGNYNRAGSNCLLRLSLRPAAADGKISTGILR